MIDLANLTIESRDKILALQDRESTPFTYKEVYGYIRRENLYFVFYHKSSLICALHGFELDVMGECLERFYTTEFRPPIEGIG